MNIWLLIALTPWALAYDFPIRKDWADESGAVLCRQLSTMDAACLRGNEGKCLMNVLGASLRLQPQLRNPSKKELLDFLHKRDFFNLAHPDRSRVAGAKAFEKSPRKDLLKGYALNPWQLPQGTVVSLASDKKCGSHAGKLGMICDGKVKFLVTGKSGELAQIKSTALAEYSGLKGKNNQPFQCFTDALVPSGWIDWKEVTKASAALKHLSPTEPAAAAELMPAE